MSFFRYLKHLLTVNNPKSEREAVEILSQKVFLRILQRERARTDRYGGKFSLAVFDFDNSNKQQITDRFLTKIILDYSKKRSELTLDESKISPILSIPMNDEGIQIYQEFASKLSNLNDIQKENQKEEENPTAISHFGSFLFVPIQDIFEWQLKRNIAED